MKKLILTAILLLIIVAGFTATHKPEKYTIEREEIDGEYFFNITYKDSTYKMMDSDQMLEFICPNCYDISSNE